MARSSITIANRLAEHVEHAQRDKAQCILDELLTIILEKSPTSLAVRKLRCSQLFSLSLRSALQRNVRSDLLLEEHLSYVDRLAQARNWAAVHRLTRQYINALIEHIQIEQCSDIERVIQIMMEETNTFNRQPRRLKQYAKDYNISPEHLSRSFSKMAGQSFREYQNQKRMAHACHLLRETTLKVAAVGQRTGYPYPSHFISCFKKHIGVTPATYRKTYAETGEAQHLPSSS